AASRLFGMMRRASFQIRTVDESRDLATMLANACPDPNRSVVGLLELLLNAVEHGNLGITYAEKSRLREQGTWEQEIERRLRTPGYAERWVDVGFTRDDNAVEIHIKDQGEGFEWEKYLDFDPERAFDSHGRGIAMSRMMSFDEMAYQGRGNEVIVKVYLDQARREAA
ncbi:MAG TPA: ATP-binding protein, partial [Chromatiaceae bacterium]|nr:ATP-binding protein [Chromatiaceae bacterium]